MQEIRVLLCVALAAIATVAQAKYDESGCPAWIDDYAVFHSQAKGRPGAKYIGFICHRNQAGAKEAGAGASYICLVDGNEPLQ